MGLFVRNPAVQALAEQVAARLGVTKTEAIRRALQHELDRAAPSLVERGRDYVRALHRSARTDQGQPADKAWIDGLYGE
jgi:antitoxin VapB